MSLMNKARKTHFSLVAVLLIWLFILPSSIVGASEKCVSSLQLNHTQTGHFDDATLEKTTLQVVNLELEAKKQNTVASKSRLLLTKINRFRSQLSLWLIKTAAKRTYQQINEQNQSISEDLFFNKFHDELARVENGGIQFQHLS
jgi:hypothetical protein